MSRMSRALRDAYSRGRGEKTPLVDRPKPHSPMWLILEAAFVVYCPVALAFAIAKDNGAGMVTMGFMTVVWTAILAAQLLHLRSIRRTRR